VDSPAASKPARPWKALAKWAFRLVVLTLVALFGWRAFEKAQTDFAAQQAELKQEIAKFEAASRESGLDEEQRRSIEVEIAALKAQRFGLDRIEYGWMFASAGLFVLGMSPAWLVWRQSLREMGEPAPIYPTLRAYYVSQVGKYIPGKAFVVVIRAALIRPFGVGIVPAVIASFVETLGLMAAGAAWAGALILLIAPGNWPLALLAVGLMLGTGIPTLPPIFRRIVGFLLRKRPEAETAPYLAGIDYRLMATSWLSFTVTWFALGASMGALLLAFPGSPSTLGEVAGLMPLLVATTALALVAGFLSLLPGGALVRELIVIALLGSAIGEFKAVCVAIAMRLVWLATEFLLAGALYAIPSGKPARAVAAAKLPDPSSA
jgi:glycosyltransferase 2 family protein